MPEILKKKKKNCEVELIDFMSCFVFFFLFSELTFMFCFFFTKRGKIFRIHWHLGSLNHLRDVSLLSKH